MIYLLNIYHITGQAMTLQSRLTELKLYFKGYAVSKELNFQQFPFAVVFM